MKLIKVRELEYELIIRLVYGLAVGAARTQLRQYLEVRCSFWNGIFACLV
jgi:hypothetical protein